MELSVLAQERAKTAIDFDEAVELAETEFAVNVLPVSPPQLGIKEDGSIILGGDLGEVRATRTGIKGLCKAVRIPDPFAQRIPFDLLQHNLSRLLMGLDSLRVVLRKDDNCAIGFLAGTKGTVSNEGILNATVKSMLAGRYDQPGFHFTDSKFVVKALSDVTVAPTTEDVSYIGQILTNSQVGLSYPMSQLHALRNSCTNSSIMPKGFGQIRMRVTAGDDEENILSGFTRKVERLSLQEASLAMRYLRMSQTRCPEAHWFGAWRGVNRVAGDPEEADMIMNCSDEKRRQVKLFVKKERDDPAANLTPIIDETYYDVFNKVTAGAHHFPLLDDKHALWNLGGKMLERVVRAAN